MEGARIGRSKPLAVLQDFAGCRLEKEVLTRAYELAAPVVHVIAGTIRIPESANPSPPPEFRRQTIAKGA